MKTKLLSLLLLGLLTTTHAQETEHFNFSVSLDPYATYDKKSPNFTLELELEEEYFYVKAGTQVHFGLEPNYFDLAGGVGLNLSSGTFRQWRYYGGIRGGMIFRGGNPNPLFGQELGIRLHFDSGFFVGARFTNDFRTDLEFFGAEKKYQQNFSVTLGKRF